MSDAESDSTCVRIEKKECKKCKRLLPITKFKPNGDKPDGTRYRMATCKECSGIGTSKASKSTKESEFDPTISPIPEDQQSVSSKVSKSSASVTRTNNVPTVSQRSTTSKSANSRSADSRSIASSSRDEAMLKLSSGFEGFSIALQELAKKI